MTKSGVEEFLPAATVMVVSVTASTTQGSVSSVTDCYCILTNVCVYYRQKIEQDELDLIFEACDMVSATTLYIYIIYCTYACPTMQAESLNEIKLHILEYVETRMSFIAPNLSQIVGSTVAAKLMGKYVQYE